METHLSLRSGFREGVPVSEGGGCSKRVEMRVWSEGRIKAGSVFVRVGREWIVCSGSACMGIRDVKAEKGLAGLFTFTSFRRRRFEKLNFPDIATDCLIQHICCHHWSLVR